MDIFLLSSTEEVVGPLEFQQFLQNGILVKLVFKQKMEQLSTTKTDPLVEIKSLLKKTAKLFKFHL